MSVKLSDNLSTFKVSSVVVVVDGAAFVFAISSASLFTVLTSLPVLPDALLKTVPLDKVTVDAASPPKPKRPPSPLIAFTSSSV